MSTGWIIAISVAGGTLFFAGLLWAIIVEANKRNKYIEEMTIRLLTPDQTKEMLAYAIGVKATQIKFRTGSEGGFYGVRVVKEGFQ
jgi:hypothetical protein